MWVQNNLMEHNHYPPDSGSEEGQNPHLLKLLCNAHYIILTAMLRVEEKLKIYKLITYSTPYPETADGGECVRNLSQPN